MADCASEATFLAHRIIKISDNNGADEGKTAEKLSFFSSFTLIIPSSVAYGDTFYFAFYFVCLRYPIKGEGKFW